MSSCIAFGCSNAPKDLNRPNKHIPGVSFHSFPADEPRRSEWIKAVRRKNWLPSKYSKLCSTHFREEMIDRTMKNVILRRNAVPTIFPGFASHLQKKPKHKTKAAKNISTSVPSVKVKKEVSEMPLFPIITSTSSIDKDKFNQSSLNGVCHESSELQIFKKMVNESTSNSEEEIGKNLPDSDNSDDSLSLDNNSKQSSEENLKHKLEIMTTLYERTCKKLKLCQEQCKLYVKQVIALEEVIDNLKQINSVTDFT